MVETGARLHTLVLVRHGESEWNQRNLFTGQRDPDLTDKGVIEARVAGRCVPLTLLVTHSRIQAPGAQASPLPPTRADDAVAGHGDDDRQPRAVDHRSSRFHV